MRSNPPECQQPSERPAHRHNRDGGRLRRGVLIPVGRAYVRMRSGSGNVQLPRAATPPMGRGTGRRQRTPPNVFPVESGTAFVVGGRHVADLRESGDSGMHYVHGLAVSRVSSELVGTEWSPLSRQISPKKRWLTRRKAYPVPPPGRANSGEVPRPPGQQAQGASPLTASGASRHAQRSDRSGGRTVVPASWPGNPIGLGAVGGVRCFAGL